MFKKSPFILFAVFLFITSAFAQNFGSGKVTEIIDGRTVVITNAGQKTTLMLRYIEVPEPEQQLSKVVKEHLEKLILGKDIKFVSRFSYSKGLIGTLFLGDVEINQQMLRDGAAWYNLPEHGNSNSEYQKIESLAKAEKRGVWSIEGLKPAWEFREEQYAKQIAAKKSVQKPKAETQMWADIPSAQANNQIKNSAKNSVRSDDDEESDKVRITVRASQPKRNAKFDKSSEAVQEMQYLLQRLLGEGMSLSSFKSSLGEVKLKVAVATDVLSKGKFKTLMLNNMDLLNDLDYAMTFLTKNNLQNLYYKGEVIKFAEKYQMTPVRAASGDFVLTKQGILNTLLDKAVKNFVEMKKAAEDDEQFND